MHRRIVLASLATLAVSPALAQSSPPPPTDAPAAPAPAAPPATTLEPAPAMKVAPPVGSAVFEATTRHIKDTLAVGSLSLAVSRIAVAKAKLPAIRQFAAFEVAEQETIADILKGMMMPDAPPSGDVKAPTDAALLINLDQAGKDMVEKMHAMKAGPDFDRDYVKAQIEGHKKLLDIQATYLKAPTSRDEADVAKLAMGMIKEHLALLAEIEKKPG